MFDHTQKSRTRLQVESNLSMLFLGAGSLASLFDHYLAGIPLLLIGFFYSREISEELKGRPGPVGPEEKKAIFRIDAIGFSLMYIAFVIWLFPIRTPVAWCLFGLATFATPIAIYACWASAFRDTPTSEEKEPIQPPETTSGK